MKRNLIKKLKHFLFKRKSLVEKHEKQLYEINSLIAEIPGNVYWTDLKGVCRGCNNNAAKLMGFKDNKEIIGKAVYSLMSSVLAETTKNNDEKVIAIGKEIVFEESGINTDGKEAIYLTRKTPLKNKKGEIIGVIGTSTDMTIRKQAEAALKKAKEQAEALSHAKTEFIRNMQHDIHTPISHIVGLAKILNEGQSSEEEAEEILGFIKTSAERLMELTEEMLQCVNSESGLLPKQQIKFDLKQLLWKIIELTKFVYREKEIEIIINYDQGVPQNLLGDRARVFRILLNLVNNALKFTSKGYIKINVKVAEYRCSKDLDLAISVEDTGIGIPEDKFAEIFEKFARLISANKNLYKGLGLGLFTVKQIVEELNGRITVESELGKGTKFTCILPFKTTLQEKTQKEQSPLSSNHDQVIFNQPAGKLKILIVEDEKFAQYVQARIMRDLGHDVDISETAQAALKNITKNHYDIIIMDIGLPDMDGLDLAKKLRNENIKIPIIAVSANADEGYKQSCLDAGMNGFLAKPLTKEKAIEILTDFIVK